MPQELREKFSKSVEIDFNVNEEYKKAVKLGGKSRQVLDKSIEQHAKMCIENSEDVMDARCLAELLSNEIEYRIRLFSYCITKSSESYLKWLKEDYERKLSLKITQGF